MDRPPILRPLNTLPGGLLDLLGIKNGGRYPEYLQTELQPTLDLFDQYVAWIAHEFNLATAGTTGAVNSGFVNISGVTGTQDISSLLSGGVITIPQNEVWYLQEGSTYTTLPAEATAFGRTMLSTTILGQASEGLPSFFQGYDTGVASGTRSNVCSVARSIWLRPGRQLFIQHFGMNSTGNIAVSARVRLVRMIV